MGPLTLRGEIPGDRESIRAVTIAAFGRNDEAGLIDQLHNEGAVLESLIAAQGDSIVGHVLFSRM